MRFLYYFCLKYSLYRNEIAQKIKFQSVFTIYIFLMTFQENIIFRILTIGASKIKEITNALRKDITRFPKYITIWKRKQALYIIRNIFFLIHFQFTKCMVFIIIREWTPNTKHSDYLLLRSSASNILSILENIVILSKYIIMLNLVLHIEVL